MLQGLSKTGHLEVVPVQDVAQNFNALLLQLLQDLWRHRDQPTVRHQMRAGDLKPGLDPRTRNGRHTWWQFFSVFSSFSLI